MHKLSQSFLGRWIGNKIFGLALEPQVKQLRTYVKRTAESQNVLSHDLTRYFSVLNKTVESLGMIRHRLTDIDEFLVQSQWVLGNLTENISAVHTTSQLNGWATTMSENIDLLEMALNDALLQTHAYQLTRTEMSHGSLSLESLPAEAFTSIKQQMLQKKLNPPELNWILKNIHVSLVEDTDDTAVFAAIIPGSSHATYNRYIIETYPKMIDALHAKQVLSEKTVVLDAYGQSTILKKTFTA